MPGGHPGDAFLADAAKEIEHRFYVGNVTIQVETGALAGATDPAQCKQVDGCRA